MRCLIWAIVINSFIPLLSFGAERAAFFVVAENKKLANTSQEIEYYLRKYIEKRMFVPAEITNREIAVFEDEINRQNQESANLITEGKKLYEEFKLDQCFFVFQKIINNLEKGSAVFEKSKDYQLALMYLGNIYQLKGETGSAKDTFIKLLLYNGKYTPDTAYFSPDIIETFEKAKTDMKSLKKGTLQIIPKPEDSQVFIDGSFVGAGIFRVEDLPQGEHLVGIKKRGYLPYTRKVTIQAELMEIVTAELVEFKEISGRYREISEIKESDMSVTLLPILKDYAKDANSKITVIVFVSGSAESPGLSGYTFYNSRLVTYAEMPISLSKDESRKKVLKTKTEELAKKILPDNIQSLPPVEKISHKKFYTTWWFYGIISAALIGAGTLGYLLLREEEKEDNSGALIISF
ncbi:MAG: PEGA domain-containing protein [Deltaproteobacteria bacterium]|nr:PEGA domain-containing protein [Deltaproteobacteria bacterium]